MATEHLDKKPHWAGLDCWWYECNGGIEIHTDYRDTEGVRVGHSIAKIQWRSLRAALKRKDKVTD
jgi:hypothetical protein